jgi:hypothetical protein
MKSIFEGWTKKIEGTICDNNGGNCVRGWIHGVRDLSGKNPSACEAEIRIGTWILANMNVPEQYVYFSPYLNCNVTARPQGDPIRALIWANNSCALDIEGFKMVDLLTQGFVPEEVTELEKVQS